MKKTLLVAFALTCGTLLHKAYAQTPSSYSETIKNPTYSTTFKSLVSSHHLPAWVLSSSTDMGSQNVTLNGKNMYVISACKPHECSTQKIAFLIDSKTRKISGVFSSYSEKSNTQNLKWINITPEDNLDGQTVLFSALSGSLENHPKNFNF
ncbi:Ivy family c-type lysozyme inhibitor [Entomobacter blattae]|uniref:Inhibitor of vertebrate lysozyme n=1 Tax=Entomobacter blattae TaxID=2762277 RepID=A0A7H1NTK8_9PROT|nr:Ivy family c-type lysozyme inhibitor [Entomobacter blattae]QNT79118.1 Inhibitor of vertebrate lysozyme [Entomobacter blattae]